MALAVEVYILRGETLNWIPELQLCQIPTQTFYLNWNCWEQSFHNAKRNFHIFKQDLKWQPFPQDICCNFVSKCSVNTKEPFWKRHNNSFYAPEKEIENISNVCLAQTPTQIWLFMRISHKSPLARGSKWYCEN